MNLVLVGLNHRTAPLALRERYAVAAGALQALDEKLAQQPELDEACAISTCNRTELLAVAREPEPASERLLRFLSEDVGGGAAPGPHLYDLRGAAVVEHLFRVAAGLDSMVLGESQILGQIKQAYRAAAQARSCGVLLHRLFHRAFRTAKRVRSRTGLGAGNVSVARVGVQLAAQIFESFEGKRVLLLGAGDTAESALHALRDAGARSVVVVNRSEEPARRLAERLGGRASPLAALEAELAAADLALLSIAADAPVVTAEQLRRVSRSRHGRPLLLIDLAIPRNVEPAANAVENVYVYDLDDLEEEATRGRARRGQAVEPAEEIVREECQRFESWRQALPLVPTVRELLERAQAMARDELCRQLGAGAAVDRAQLERIADSLVARLFHAPLEALRAESEAGAGAWYAATLAQMFGLDEPGTDKENS
jgi:glutamyl-tRNA reductase